MDPFSAVTAQNCIHLLDARTTSDRLQNIQNLSDKPEDVPGGASHGLLLHPCARCLSSAIKTKRIQIQHVYLQHCCADQENEFSYSTFTFFFSFFRRNERVEIVPKKFTKIASPFHQRMIIFTFSFYNLIKHATWIIFRVFVVVISAAIQ